MPADFCLSHVRIRHPTQKEKRNRGITRIDPTTVPTAQCHAPQPDKPETVVSQKSDFQQLPESTMISEVIKPQATSELLGQPRLQYGKHKSKPKCKQRVAEQQSHSLM